MWYKIAAIDILRIKRNMLLAETYLRVEDRHILYDYKYPITIEWFDPSKLSQIAELSGESERGRKKSIFFKIDGQEYMLKHYHRGGMAAHFLKDYYFYMGHRRVHVFREWRLLHQLQRWHLPVPTPCAASYTFRLVFYTADMILGSCRPARPVSSLLCEQDIEERHWQLIGKTIRRFHNKNVFHADLNAHNILLLPEKDQVFLVDFDRSFICKKRNSWQQSNLDRLSRSLEKLHKEHGSSFHYSADNFSALVDAYRGKDDSTVPSNHDGGS